MWNIVGGRLLFHIPIYLLHLEGLWWPCAHVYYFNGKFHYQPLVPLLLLLYLYVSHAVHVNLQNLVWVTVLWNIQRAVIVSPMHSSVIGWRQEWIYLISSIGWLQAIPTDQVDFQVVFLSGQLVSHNNDGFPICQKLLRNDIAPPHGWVSVHQRPPISGDSRAFLSTRLESPERLFSALKFWPQVFIVNFDLY